MLLRAVTFVFVETVLGMALRQCVHFRIAGGLCQNGCGGYFDDFAVAFDDGFGRDVQMFGNAVAVDEYFSGRTAKPSTARFIASMVACRMLRLAISSGPAAATCHATA